MMEASFKVSLELGFRCKWSASLGNSMSAKNTFVDMGCRTRYVDKASRRLGNAMGCI